MTINNGNGKNVIIGILVALLVIMNVIVPFMNQQNTDKKLSEAKSLMAQLSSAPNAQNKQAIGQKILALNPKSAALSASADGIKGSKGASSTTTDCNFLYRAAMSSLDLGAIEAFEAIYELYFYSCVSSVESTLTSLEQ